MLESQVMKWHKGLFSSESAARLCMFCSSGRLYLCLFSVFRRIEDDKFQIFSFSSKFVDPLAARD